LAASSTCTYYLLPGDKEETPTATISGSNTAASVQVNITVGAASSTTLSVPTTGIIPVNNGQGSLVVTNTGLNTAYNVQAVLGSTGWGSTVTQDSSDCVTIASSGTCTLYFSSTTPYVAQSGISVTGDNITSPPTTALAFQMNSGLVFSADGTTAKVVTTSDISTSSGMQWYNGTYNTTGAQSLTDGEFNHTTGNTYVITHSPSYQPIPNPATYAAALCYDYTEGSASPGDWYLPALCELGNTGVQNTPCSGSDNIENIYSNLYSLGFLQNMNRMNGGGSTSGPGDYWSSTEVSNFNSPSNAYLQQFGSGGASQFTDGKNNSFGVRCVWAFTY
jgi:hypothetical protein